MYWVIYYHLSYVCTGVLVFFLLFFLIWKPLEWETFILLRRVQGSSFLEINPGGLLRILCSRRKDEMIFCISAWCGSALRDALRKTMRSNKTLATTTSATMDNKNKKLKTHRAANSCVHQPYERMHAKCVWTMYVVSWRLNRNCLNGGFKATICPLPIRKWQINTSKKNTVCRGFEQYNGKELLSAT